MLSTGYQVPEVHRDVARLAGPDQDLPVRQLLVQLPGYLCHVAGDGELAVVYLVGDAAGVDELRDDLRDELACSPGGQDRLALAVHDPEPGVDLARLDLAGDYEVGEREVRGHEHRGVPVSYTHLRAHETRHDLVCRLLLEKKKTTTQNKSNE